MILRRAAISFAASLSLWLGQPPSRAFAAEKKPARAAAAPAPKADRARPPAPPPAPKEPRPNQAQVVDKLLKMSPGERQSALANLAPARRENIERRLGEIEKMAPAQQNRLLHRAEVLNSLPPERANQIRRSAREFQLLPDDRRPVLNREMNRMMRMPEEQRRERMNSEDFRSRYSAGEQQMMQDLMAIRPQPQP